MPSPNKGRFAVNGKRLLLDTNAIVQLLAGNPEVGEWVRGADFLATSVICEFEFLSFPRLSEGDAALYAAFAGRVRTFPVPSGDPDFTRRVVAFRNAAGKRDCRRDGRRERVRRPHGRRPFPRGARTGRRVFPTHLNRRAKGPVRFLWR